MKKTSMQLKTLWSLTYVIFWNADFHTQRKVWRANLVLTWSKFHSQCNAQRTSKTAKYLLDLSYWDKV